MKYAIIKSVVFSSLLCLCGVRGSVALNVK